MKTVIYQEAINNQIQYHSEQIDRIKELNKNPVWSEPRKLFKKKHGKTNFEPFGVPGCTIGVYRIIYEPTGETMSIGCGVVPNRLYRHRLVFLNKGKDVSNPGGTTNGSATGGHMYKYDPHRKNLMDILGDKYKIAGLVNGERIPKQEYYQKMIDSKIIMAPLGYGEMAPRDLESAMFGSVLMKPDMSYILSEPFIYEDDKTYIAVNYDWSNLEEKIDYVLLDYDNIRERLVENMRKEFQEKYDLKNLVLHMYEIFRNLKDVEQEN